MAGRTQHCDRCGAERDWFKMTEDENGLAYCEQYADLIDESDGWADDDIDTCDECGAKIDSSGRLPLRTMWR